MRNASRPPFDLQGHRGARGLLPENTVASFLEAARYGMHVVELDLVLTRDDDVLVSHEPWCSADYCLDPAGNPIPHDEEQRHNIRRMSLADVRRYDCGAIGHPNFPEQRATPSVKPLFAEVVAELDAATHRLGRAQMRFNVEVKSRADWVDVFQPSPERLAERVYAEVERLGILARSTLQSFDPAVVNRFRELDAHAEVAFLVENDRSLEANLERLNFEPDIYAPWFHDIDRALVEAVHAADMAIVTWTVNDADDLVRLRDLGVDGIITDYPDRAAACFPEHLVR